jgi:hypothetical protein
MRVRKRRQRYPLPASPSKLRATGGRNAGTNGGKIKQKSRQPFGFQILTSIFAPRLTGAGFIRPKSGLAELDGPFSKPTSEQANRRYRSRPVVLKVRTGIGVPHLNARIGPLSIKLPQSSLVCCALSRVRSTSTAHFLLSFLSDFLTITEVIFPNRLQWQAETPTFALRFLRPLRRGRS